MQPKYAIVDEEQNNDAPKAAAEVDARVVPSPPTEITNDDKSNQNETHTNQNEAQNDVVEDVPNVENSPEAGSQNELIPSSPKAEQNPAVSEQREENAENNVADSEANKEKTAENQSEAAGECVVVAISKRESKSSEVKLYSEHGTVGVVSKSLANIEGDVCRMPTNSKSKMKGKRRLEAKTAKKTFVLMLTFLTCRICYLIGVAARQSPAATAQALLVKYRAEVAFVQISFFSCFFNSFAFILVTDFFKMEAERCLEKVIAKLKHIWSKL
jgi:hypothetical protein